MIYAILGRPGGGKSFEATKYHILPAILEDKRKVITNIPIQVDHIQKIHGKEYADLVTVLDGEFHTFGGKRPFSTAQDFLKHDEWRNEKGQGVLFIVDEAHLSLGRDAEKEVLEYLSMHRHYGHDIAVLTQNQRKLNRDLRDMVEVAYHCAKLSTYGEEGYVRKTYHGLDDMRNPVHLEQREYTQSYFPYYKSHTKSNGAVEEALVKDSKAIKNPYKKATYVFFVLGALMMIGATVNAMSDDKPEPKTDFEPAQVQTKKTLPVPPAQSPGKELPPKQDEPPKKPPKTKNEEIQLTIEQASKQYHPYHKVQIHIEGSFHDYGTGESKIFFSASRNGQRLFSLGLKELVLAGYDVQVLTECAVKLKFYDYQDFVTCDTPTLGVSTPEIAKN